MGEYVDGEAFGLLEMKLSAKCNVSVSLMGCMSKSFDRDCGENDGNSCPCIVDSLHVSNFMCDQGNADMPFRISPLSS